MVTPLVLPIEDGEATLSWAVRHARVFGVELTELLGKRAQWHISYLRDWPTAFARLERKSGSEFERGRRLLTEHSAALYFSFPIPEPYRAHSLLRVTEKIDNLLLTSIGCSWPHLRFCERCAQAEYSAFRFSWWHRDHQLPWETICDRHGSRLWSIPLSRLDLQLPHEIQYSALARDISNAPISKLELTINRLERLLASQYEIPAIHSMLSNVRRSVASVSDDAYMQLDYVIHKLKPALIELRNYGAPEAQHDFDRLVTAVNNAIRAGIPYADPVALVILIALLGASRS